MKKIQIVCGDVWNNRDVYAAAEGAESRLFCVAYATQACEKLFKSGDLLVCDASRRAVACGETAPRFLLKLLRMGVRIYSCEALHVKCAVFDDFVLLGSANMSESSANRLIELSVLQKNPRLALDVQAFIGGLTKKAKCLAADELKKLCKVHKVRQPWQRKFKKRKSNRSRRGSTNHLVTSSCITNSPRSVTQEELYESEEKARNILEEEGFTRRGYELRWYYANEVWGPSQPKSGDSIINILYSSRKKNARATVYGPGKVVMVDRKRKAHIVHFLVPEKGVAYSSFRSLFKTGKSLNRHGVADELFRSMEKFIKRANKRR